MSPNLPSTENPAEVVARAIVDFIGKIPASSEHKSNDPDTQAKAVAVKAARSAAVTAGTLALPPGPLGWLTILPELIGVWKIQSQMVADIAAIYGKTETLSREPMLYCLFRHSAAQVVRDLVMQVGERVLIRRGSVEVLQRAAQKIGIRLTQRVISKGISRWLPVIGAVGVGAYAYYDTGQVAETAMELFKGNVEIEDGEGAKTGPDKV